MTIVSPCVSVCVSADTEGLLMADSKAVCWWCESTNAVLHNLLVNTVSVCVRV